jgi:hypothetical protein
VVVGHLSESTKEGQHRSSDLEKCAHTLFSSLDRRFDAKFAAMTALRSRVLLALVYGLVAWLERCCKELIL